MNLKNYGNNRLDSYWNNNSHTNRLKRIHYTNQEMDMQVPEKTISGFHVEADRLFILYDTSLRIDLPSSDKGIDINNIYISSVNCIFDTDYKGFICAF